MRRWLVAGLVLGTLSAALPNGVRADSFRPRGVSSFTKGDVDRGHRYRYKDAVFATALSDRLTVGGEAELSKYETMLAGLPGIQVKSYDFRGVVQYVAWPNQLSPYLGGRVGVSVLRLDEDAVESVLSSVEIDNFGIRLAGLAFLGIQLPISRDVSLFTEARVGAVFDVIDPSSVEMGISGLDGYSGMTGVRMRF